MVSRKIISLFQLQDNCRELVYVLEQEGVFSCTGHNPEALRMKEKAIHSRQCPFILCKADYCPPSQKNSFQRDQINPVLFRY